METQEVLLGLDPGGMQMTKPVDLFCIGICPFYLCNIVIYNKKYRVWHK